jgi:uncharacterized protein (TIGR03118 family)
MFESSSAARSARRIAVLAVALALSAPLFAEQNEYQVTTLVADQSGKAPNTDGNLQNAWGLVAGATSTFWISANHTGFSTLYNGLGAQITPPSPVVVPATSGTGPGSPTGITTNPSKTDFLVDGTAAIFLWATEDGGIAAWKGGPSAFITFTAKDGAVYKGIAIAGNGTDLRLYAADFHNGKIDVLDNTFAPTTVSGRFADPTMPARFKPFNIMNLQGNLYVAYAVREDDGDDEVAGEGLGFVDVFDADGFLIERVASRGKLNAPWGMAIAPAGFGRFSNHLLVGNNGDGRINAYDLKNFSFDGQLHMPNGRLLTIDGLWGLSFGNGFQHQPTDTLFFTAGPNEETNGLFGKIEAQ